MTDAAAVRGAIEAGVAFLEAAQLSGGEIPIQISGRRDMRGPGTREPAVFPAALAARALSAVPAAATLHSRALDFLLREMHPDGLWRHPSTGLRKHWHTPLDVDDTALASAALASAGRTFPDNRALLLAQRGPAHGLFLTWFARWWPHPIATYRFFRTIAERGDVDSVINANAVFYLGECEETRPAIEHMLRIVRDGREMISTIWYGSPFTIWYFFSHALRAVGQPAGDLIVSRVEATAPADALEKAAAATSLLLWNRLPDIGPLLDAQLPSGAWPSCGFYHMGRRRSEQVPRTPWWGSESLTTVFAVEALSRYQDALAPTGG